MAAFQRSYTMNLKPATSEQDKFILWNRLFLTHWSVNEGAKIFGELFLNLRGGLSPELDIFDLDKVKDDKKKKAFVMGRRRLLALGWLSVEDNLSAGEHPFRIREIPVGRNMGKSQASTLLTEILKNKGIKDEAVIKEWIDDCTPSLIANIREDAVWINRASSFNSITPCPTKDEVWIVLSGLLGLRFLDLSLEEVKGKETEYLYDLGEKETQSKSDPSKKARELFGNLFTQNPVLMKNSRDKKDTFAKEFYLAFKEFKDYEKLKEKIESWRKEKEFPLIENPVAEKYPPEVTFTGSPCTVSKRYRKLLVSLELWPSSQDENGNIPKTEKTEDKTHNQVLLDYLLKACNEGNKGTQKIITPVWANNLKAELELKMNEIIRIGESSSTELQRLMIKMAARRISQTLSWIKINEQTKHDAYQKKNKAFKLLSEIDKNGEACKWLENYELFRTDDSGGEEYHISLRAISCWKQILEEWQKNDSPKALREKVKEVQAEEEKFGDARLFEDLADDNARSVWLLPDGNKTPDILNWWCEYRTAEIDESRFKIPCYCHPHPFKHPVYVEYGKSNPKVIFAMKNNKVKKGHIEHGWNPQNPRSIALSLFNNGNRESSLVPFIWESKRLWKDLGGEATQIGDIPRSDRMGLSGKRESVKPKAPFQKEVWNARLQSDRRTLEKLEKYWNPESMKWIDDGKFLIQSKWFITFGPDMETAEGPWKLYLKEKYVDNKILGNRSKENQKRGYRAKKLLSGYPAGMRILSVDLGHRYAASCAVWETITKKQITEELAYQPDNNSLFEHSCKTIDKKIKNTVYRRIGEDSIDAPWAKLEKQFTIKLQGEDKSCYLLRSDEKELFRSILSKLSCLNNDTGHNILEMIENLLRIVKAKIYRQGILARISYSMTAQYKPGKGGQKSPLSDEDKIHYLSENLAAWSAIMGNQEWNEDVISDWYKTYISHLVSGPKPKEGNRKSDRDKIIEYFLPAARKLYDDNETRIKIHDLFKELWDENNKQLSAVLKEIKKIILPKGIRYFDKNTDNPSKWKNNQSKLKQITHRGGLSMQRIVAIEEYYKLAKAYKNHPEPDDLTKNIPLPGDNSSAGFNQRIRDTLERMKEQRVKQIASRIVESALGLGIEGYKKRPLTPENKPCQAIVIEDLSHYRPDELQTRRENRRLMQWSSSKVKKYLKEACEMHDVRLVEISPEYTSRQDSRTGAAGLRCIDINIREFLKDSSRWQNKINTIQKKPANKKSNLDQYLIELNESLGNKYKDKVIPSDNFVRIPRKGGDVFVSSSKESPVSKGIQADLNAAANIGLKALLDPDWAGAWWYILIEVKSNHVIPYGEKYKGSECLRAWKFSGLENQVMKNNMNLWRDLQSQFSGEDKWMSYKEYNELTEKRVINILRERAGLELIKE